MSIILYGDQKGKLFHKHFFQFCFFLNVRSPAGEWTSNTLFIRLAGCD